MSPDLTYEIARPLKLSAVFVVKAEEKEEIREYFKLAIDTERAGNFPIEWVHLPSPSSEGTIRQIPRDKCVMLRIAYVAFSRTLPKAAYSQDIAIGFLPFDDGTPEGAVKVLMDASLFYKKPEEKEASSSHDS
jgi:hypothetical protein